MLSLVLRWFRRPKIRQQIPALFFLGSQVIMQLFGLTFVLFYLKLSDGHGYWNRLRISEEETYKKAVKVQRLKKKLVRCELAITFLTKCRDSNVYPAFTRWKNANSKDRRSRDRYRRKVLLDEIRSKHTEARNLRSEVTSAENDLYPPMTFIKKNVLRWSISRLGEAERRLVERRHEKKFANLLREKRTIDGTLENPNTTIWNFSNHTLTEQEELTLKFGLKHGIAKRPNEDDILASAEAVWHQIEKKGLCKDGPTFQRQTKNHLRAMAFNLINLEDKRFFKDRKMLDTIKELRQNVALLSPDKGNGIVVMDKEDYKNSLEELFADRSKFRILDEDPTNKRFTSIQTFLRSLKKRGEISEEEFKSMFPENAKIGRAHGTAKVHKEFERLPPLRPIVDTIGSTHYGVGKYITKLLNPLTQNQYSLKDSFETADRIRNQIPDTLYEEGYVLVSFDVKSLFTNVPLKKTIDVILDRVYRQNLVATSLKKRTLKKLITDTCNKTAFLVNGKIFEQTDGVSMGASLGPVLANIIMTEMEREVVDKLMDDGTLQFYARYVDDTLLLVKPDQVDEVLRKFNSFHPNLEFTVDRFEDCVPHFLDLEIHRSGITIFRKETHTGQFTNFDSFTRWAHKTAWIRSLVNRAKRLCDPRKLKPELAAIRRFAAYNGFPQWVAKRVIQRALQPKPETGEADERPTEEVWINLPYLGDHGETIITKTTNRLRKLMKKEKNVVFKIFLETTKIAFFTSNKDQVPALSRSMCVYQFTCPGCASQYIGKTTTTLFCRSGQHGWTQRDSSVYKHFQVCQEWKYLVGLMELGGDVQFDHKQSQIEAVRANTEVLSTARNHLKLDFLEAIAIKHRDPDLNQGLKSCKDLALF